MTDKSCAYVIAAKLYRIIKIEAFVLFPETQERLWERRVLIITPFLENHPPLFRRPMPKTRNPIKAKQLTLFKYKKYVYHILAAKMKTQPRRWLRFYGQRDIIKGNSNNSSMIIPLAKVPTQDWVTNGNCFQMPLFEHVISRWIKGLCLSKEYLYYNIDTLRTVLWVLPAKLINTYHQKVLQLSRGYYYREQFERAYQKSADFIGYEFY